MKTEEKGKAEKLFTSFGKKVDRFLEELDQAGHKVHDGFQEKYDDLSRLAEKLKKETRNEDRWREVEDRMKKAGDELKKAFQAAFSKRETKKKAAPMKHS